MVGKYPTIVRIFRQLQTVGSVDAGVEPMGELFAAGQLRGHEFLYSVFESKDFCRGPIYTLYTVRKGQGAAPQSEEYCYKRCLAGYLHLHFGSNPVFDETFVGAGGRNAENLTL